LRIGTFHRRLRAAARDYKCQGSDWYDSANDQIFHAVFRFAVEPGNRDGLIFVSNRFNLAGALLSRNRGRRTGRSRLIGRSALSLSFSMSITSAAAAMMSVML
jgi:hypothetical protein